MSAAPAPGAPAPAPGPASSGARSARGRGLSAVSVALALLALGAGSWVNSAVPSVRDRVSDPFVREAAIGEPVKLRTATLEVTGVEGAPSVLTPVDMTVSSASGVWVVLQVRIEGESEPVSLSGVTIESADGRSYAQSRSDIPTACADIQPHVAWICQVAVEMPLEAIPGAHAVIPVNGSVRGDTVAEIDLGLDAQIAESWRAREEPLTITPSGPEEQPL